MIWVLIKFIIKFFDEEGYPINKNPIDLIEISKFLIKTLLRLS